MGGIRSRLVFGLVVFVAAFGSSAVASSAATTILPDPTEYTFLPGPYSQGLGELAIYDNSDASTYHNVYSTQAGPDGNALFFSPSALPGEVKQVKGTQYLKAGTYPFFCTLHGAAMSGDLIIDGSQGKVVPRPTVKISVLNQKLKAVKRSGVKVKVTAVTAVKGVSIFATKGKVRLGAKSGISLGAGKSRTYTLPLTKAGRKAIKTAKVVQVKAATKVLFGKPATSSRRVR